eukprot:5781684-Amphidinium_carterae.1
MDGSEHVKFILVDRIAFDLHVIIFILATVDRPLGFRAGPSNPPPGRHDTDDDEDDDDDDDDDVVVDAVDVDVDVDDNDENGVALDVLR